MITEYQWQHEVILLIWRSASSPRAYGCLVGTHCRQLLICPRLMRGGDDTTKVANPPMKGEKDQYIYACRSARSEGRTENGRRLGGLNCDGSRPKKRSKRATHLSPMVAAKTPVISTSNTACIPTMAFNADPVDLDFAIYLSLKR